MLGELGVPGVYAGGELGDVGVCREGDADTSGGEENGGSSKSNSAPARPVIFPFPCSLLSFEVGVFCTCTSVGVASSSKLSKSISTPNTPGSVPAANALGIECGVRGVASVGLPTLLTERDLENDEGSSAGSAGDDSGVMYTSSSLSSCALSLLTVR